MSVPKHEFKKKNVEHRASRIKLISSSPQWNFRDFYHSNYLLWHWSYSNPPFDSRWSNCLLANCGHFTNTNLLWYVVSLNFESKIAYKATSIEQIEMIRKSDLRSSDATATQSLYHSLAFDSTNFKCNCVNWMTVCPLRKSWPMSFLLNSYVSSLTVGK